MQTTKQIIINYLTNKKYDGLFNKEKHCACLKEDIVPCNQLCTNCTAGYKTFDDGKSFKVSLINEE